MEVYSLSVIKHPNVAKIIEQFKLSIYFNFLKILKFRKKFFGLLYISIGRCNSAINIRLLRFRLLPNPIHNESFSLIIFLNEGD